MAYFQKFSHFATNKILVQLQTSAQVSTNTPIISHNCKQNIMHDNIMSTLRLIR